MHIISVNYFNSYARQSWKKSYSKSNAEVVARDTQNDISLIIYSWPCHLPSKNREIKFGDSSRIRMGDKVFTIGYPHTRIMGFKTKYTEGVISSVTEIRDNPTVFQTTVPI